jgi:hypothetical protein
MSEYIPKKITKPMVSAAYEVLRESGALALPDLGHSLLVRKMLEAAFSAAIVYKKEAPVGVTSQKNVA